MRSVRRRMMAGEELSECEVCTNKLLNTDVYRTYFWHLFQHKYDEIANKGALVRLDWNDRVCFDCSRLT